MSRKRFEKTKLAIAKRVKSARTARGFSVVKAAKEAGISRDAWNRIEVARCSIPCEALPKISKVLQRDVDYLILGRAA